MVTTHDMSPNSWTVGGLTGGGVLQGPISGYAQAVAQPPPYITINFVGNGDLKIELAVLKRLVEQLEKDIDDKFGSSVQSSFSSYSRTFSSPGRSESYSFGA